MKTLIFYCYLATVFFAFTVSKLQADPLRDHLWPQWRGPARDGHIEASPWPRDLSPTHLNSAWSIPHEPSYSGPIVSQDRVFVTETRGKRFEVVRALDRETGQKVWETQWEGSMKVPFFAAANGSWIRATPAFDGERLYVAGMKDVLVCLDAASGGIVWKLDFPKETGADVPSFGYVSSPLVLGDHLFVQAGGAFTKLDKLTGKIIWQSLNEGGGMNGGAFSSPTNATICGVSQIIVQTRSRLAGVSLEDGTVLWSQDVPAFRGMNILTPTVINDSIFTSSYGGGSFLFKVSLGASGWKVEEAWRHKTQAYMSSPIVIDGHIYMHLRNQRFVCLDAATGTDRWTSKPFGKYCSLIANGSKLLALDERGELLLIEASPEEFRLIDRRRVAGDSWAHLAIAGNDVFVRDLEATKRFVWK